MAILEEMEKFGKKVVKGATRRGKMAEKEVEKTAEKLVKKGKGLAASAAAKLQAGKNSSANVAQRSQLASVDTSGVNMGPGSRDKARFPK
jgi:hypothetical protein